MRKFNTDRSPHPLKLPDALWTRATLSLPIEQRFGIRLPARTKLQLVKAAARHLRSVPGQLERIRK